MSALLKEWQKNEIAKFEKNKDSFNPGDVVRVFVKVFEGDKERIQPFEGVVISKRGAGMSEMFTVRRLSYGVGIERTFPLHTPVIQKIKVVKKGKVRRAKLYYLRGKIGKHAKIEEDHSPIHRAESAVVEPQTAPKTEEKVAEQQKG